MSKRKVVFSLIFLWFYVQANAQRFELMSGIERLFFDIQWYEKFDANGKWTLFSRTRGTYDYKENTDFFSGAYFEYNTPSGFGPTFLGRVSNTGVGAELGIHFAKSIKDFSIYALISQEITSEFKLSWFSIVRYTPKLSNNWKVYSSIELFSNFDNAGHNVSVQRIRAGFSKNKYFFGLGLNTAITGDKFHFNYTNPGIFVKKQF